MNIKKAKIVTEFGGNPTPLPNSHRASLNEKAVQALYYNELLCTRLKVNDTDDILVAQETVDFDLISTIIPRDMHLLPDLTEQVKWDSAKKEYVHPGKELPILVLPKVDDDNLVVFRGELFLATDLALTNLANGASGADGTVKTDNSSASLSQSALRAHPCSTHKPSKTDAGSGSDAQTIASGRGDGTNGNACASVVSFSSAKAITQGNTDKDREYLSTVWYWDETYPYRELKPGDELSKEQRLHYELYSRFEEKFIKMVAMKIPSGMIVWIPILDDINQSKAKKVDKLLRKALSDGNFQSYLLTNITYLDGPDIFIADCSFS